jgi:methionine-rich copper-binding protein CopC
MKLSRNHLLSIALMMVFAFSIFTPITVLAHELTPTSASPAEGAILQQSPDQVQLIFSEEIAEQGSSIQVFDDQGKQIDPGNGGVDLNDASHTGLVVSLPVLSEGVYQVKWMVTLSDGDASQGEYYFGIGNVTVPQSPAEAPEPETKTSSPVILWVAIVAVLILVAAIVVFWIRKARLHA